MKVLNIPAQSVYVDQYDILVLAKASRKLELVRIKWPKLRIEHICSFHGHKSLLLVRLRDLHLASVDRYLLVSRDLAEWTPTLEVKSNNIVWHACETPEGIIVQEYGESPTSLYMSDNGCSWRRILTNIEVDPLSRHFHYISYDPYRNMCYVTLGDGNLIRAITLRKGILEPIYKGPWQFVPVLVLKDKVVFGFDSGIVKGGVGIYYPELKKWEFIFLRWKDKHVRYVQMCDLKTLESRNIWCAALGVPQAVIISKDLENWKLLYLESFDETFNHHMNVSLTRDLIACSTGNRLVLFDYSDIEHALKSDPVIIRYRPLLSEVKGLLFKLKRLKFYLGTKCILNKMLRYG